MSRRAEIEHFCRGFLHGEYHHLHTTVSEYDEDILSCVVDILPRLSEHCNFDSTFQAICRSVFETTSSSSSTGGCIGRVLAVLSFAVHIDSGLKYHSWYSREEIVGSLSSVLLLYTNFDPKQITEKPFCTLF